MLTLRKIIYVALGLIVFYGALELWQVLGSELVVAFAAVVDHGGVAAAVDASGVHSGQWACLWVLAFLLTQLSGKTIAQGCTLGGR